MPKGRVFAPPTECDGVWFGHRGAPTVEPHLRFKSTTTGLMLTGPWREDFSNYPPAPPPAYNNKHESRNFKQSNNFSAHDNRNSFQDHGVYFGDGTASSRTLGKNLTEAAKRQHHTAHDYLTHRAHDDTPAAATAPTYSTEAGSHFTGRPGTDAPTRRRFPRVHAPPAAAQAPAPPPPVGGEVSGEAAPTPLHVLAVSQEPLLPANQWKYAYHGRAQCYPPYDRRGGKVAYQSPWAFNSAPAAAALQRSHPTTAAPAAVI